MGLLNKLLGLEPKLIKLISARIVTDEDHHYFISFSKHHPRLQLSEFVRLILHYYAKILFNFDPSDPEMSQSAFILKNMIQSLLDKGIRKDSNILQDAEIDDVAKIVSSAPVNIPREIVVTLFFCRYNTTPHNDRHSKKYLCPTYGVFCRSTNSGDTD